jgi:GT2 family glycosyltransferase
MPMAVGAVLRSDFARSGERRFCGYVVDIGNLRRRFTVEVIVDGYPVKSILADSYVDELARDQVGDGCYGFSLSLPDSVVSAGEVIETRLANLGTAVGDPIVLKHTSAIVPRATVPGEVRWLGGLRFSGWLPASDATTTSNVLVDGNLIMRARASIWSHINTSEEDARPVRAFDFHLPERFADGCVHRVAVMADKGEPLQGSPLVFVAFGDGLGEIARGDGESEHGRTRAELLDRLVPMSIPFSDYQAWRERFPVGSGRCGPLRGAVIMVGRGAMSDTLETLQEQLHSSWVAASLPPTSEMTGFDTEVARSFLAGEGEDCDFVVFGLAGTLLAPPALQRIAGVFAAREGVQAVYGDLDVQSADGTVWPLAFPAFDYERMLEQGYCAYLFAARRDAAERALAAGAADLYRMFNALVDETITSCSDIVHLPGSLGTLPQFDRAETGAALAAASRKHLERKGIAAQVTPSSCGILPAVRIVRDLDRPSVTIIIPARNRRERLQQCIESIQPSAKRFEAEIIVVDNDSADPDTLDYLADIDHRIAKVLRVPGYFNFARLNNCAAEATDSEVLCLISNDVKALDDNWLAELLGRIAAPDVGAVGAMLVWPDGIVQHGGIVLGPNFSATHAFNDRIESDVGYGDLLRVAHECSAVTAACLVTRRRDYLDVGGMDEIRFPIHFNDVDYCLKLRVCGKRIVFTPHARLLCRESASRGLDVLAEHNGLFARETQSLRAKWGNVLAADPYYSPMLSLDPIPFSALAWPARNMAPRTNVPPVPVEIPPGY